MTDVFISYARDDRERARLFAHALEARGWSVWWDRKIVAGQTFDDTIERQLETAKAVVVLWSTHSIDSEWVRSEAARAAERDVLVPALIEHVRQPLEFRRRHAADLTDWDGDPSNPEFQGLCEGIAARTTAPAPQGDWRRTPARGPHWRRYWPAAVGAIVVVLAGVGAYQIWTAGEEASLGTGLELDRSARVVDVPASGTHDIDNPWPLKLGATYKISLDRNEDHYLRLTEPAEAIKIVLDMRRVENRRGALQSRLALLDQDGGVVQERTIGFNEVDVGFRKTASWSSRQPVRVGFKLLNAGDPADFWLTVRKEPARQFIPLFGDVVPKPLPLGHDESGSLEGNEGVYYTMAVPAGDYRVIVDFVNARRQNTIIRGSLALLDDDGGNYRRLLSFNEIDVSYRKVATFPVRNQEPIILRVQNDSGSVRYTVKVEQSQ